MKKLFVLTLIILLSNLNNLFTQDSIKRISAVRINNPSKIDAVLDDNCWKDIPPAEDFIQLRPYNSINTFGFFVTPVNVQVDMQGQENGPEDKNWNAVWKNSIFTYTDEIIDNYLDNLRKTLDSPQTNSISLRILYYVDYLYFKKNK